MGGPFDSLGLGLAVAGAVIILAGMFLTPMRTVILGGARPRPRPEPASPAQAADRPGRAASGRPADPRTADYREQEALFARTLLTAQKTAEDLVRNAQAEAQEIIARAEAEANETARLSRKTASEVLQKAHEDADVIVASAKQKASAWLALLQTEADQLAAEAHQAFESAQRTVEQRVASLTARFERRIAEWDTRAWAQPERTPELDGASRPSVTPAI